MVMFFSFFYSFYPLLKRVWFCFLMSYSFEKCMHCFISENMKHFFKLSYYFRLFFWLLILWQCFLMVDLCALELWFSCSFWVGKSGFVTYISLSKDFAVGQQAPGFSNLKPDLPLTIWNFSPVFISYCQHNPKSSVVHSNKHFFGSPVCEVVLI